VFIHGWLLSQEYWHPLIQALSPQYQCLSYDLRGFGRSNQLHSLETLTSKSDFGYAPTDYAHEVGLLLQSLQIKSAWLVGHSLGGTIALWAAAQFPEQVKGVVCVNSGGGIYFKEAFERFRTAGAQMTKFRPPWLSSVPLLDWVFSHASVAKPLPRSWGKQRLIDFVIADAEAALQSLLNSTTEAEVHRLPQLVAQLKQPVHFVLGTQDTVMEPQYVRHLASFHWAFNGQGDNICEISDCGHLSMLEQTAQVAAYLQVILSQHSAMEHPPIAS
jgi:2-succinyl-6-hydroxy-2,4-cyclohexadiene-1-carboxylate synthase